MDREDESFLSASMLGDIREDVQFLGLTFKDIAWIILITFICGGFPFLLPVAFWFKMLWIITVFVLMLFARYLKWPYRFKRLRLYLKQAKSEDGEKLPETLGIMEDGWFYRSFKDIHIVIDVKAPPWNTAVLSKKRQRLGGYENFLRACVREGFETHISAEQVPDFRHEIWNNMKSTKSLSTGIEKLRNQRIQMFKDLVEKGEARRSEYTLVLSINELSIAIRERDDEPEGLSKEQLKRYRMVTELREKLTRVLQYLEMGGHSCTILSGYSVPEILGRWWDRSVWEVWKANENVWEESEVSATEENSVEVKPEKVRKNRIKAVMTRLGGIMGVFKNLFKRNKKETINVNEFIEGPAAAAEELEENTDQAEPVAAELEWDIDQAEPAAAELEWNIDQAEPVAIGDLEENTDQAEPAAAEPERNIDQAVSIENLKKKRKKIDVKEKILSAVSKISQKKMNKKRPIKAQNDSAGAEPQGIKADLEMPSSTLNGVRILTSPAPSGKTFLTANIATANGSEERRVAIIDLSPDRGVLTVLNPMSTVSEYDSWEAWVSRNAPGVTVWTPKQYVSMDAIIYLITEQAKVGAVLVDVPWRFPGIEKLLTRFNPIAVIDSDYHHWLQWEREVNSWDGDIWLNQSDEEMRKLISQLVREKFNKSIEATFPSFPEANKWLLQGRPLASDPQVSRFFVWSKTGMEEKVC